uniref:Uncharacterized protein n=1 Tax=Aegilops tauschii subsp. strangulata TaxID=200361 RepID=A0A453QWI5_AEGTS
VNKSNYCTGKTGKGDANQPEGVYASLKGIRIARLAGSCWLQQRN